VASLRVLSDQDVRKCIDIKGTLTAVEKAYVAKSSGLAHLYPVIDEQIGDCLEYSMVASGILRFMCPVPSETAKHVPWVSGLYRTQKPAEMDQMWTKLVHAQPDGAHANQAASGQAC